MAFTTTTGAGGTSLIGTSGVDTATVAGNSFPLFIGAQASNDILVFTGSTAGARVELGKGADSFNAAGLSTSTVSGNFGNDVITITGTVTGTTALVNGNQGADSITLNGATITKGASILGGADNDTIVVGTAILSEGGKINGNKGADTITVGVSATAMSNSTIFGGEGNDTMTAASVAVVFSGDKGEDLLTGSTAGDKLYGGDGNDTIKASAAIDAARDTLTGGAGTDSFQFLGNNTAATQATYDAAGGVADVITDFTVGTDKITTSAVFAFGGAIQAGNYGAINTLYAISGTLNSDGTFTQKTIAAGGFDTLLAVSNAAGGTVSNTAETLVILDGVLATSVTSASFTA